MFQKLAVLSYLIISTTCTVYHQAPVPLVLDVQYHAEPNYNFAYDVHDPHTGDIKNQHESRRGDTVIGQYSLIQPDGVRRVVEYRADEHTGFQATVNNEGRPAPAANPHEQVEEETPRRSNVAVHVVHPWPAPAVSSTTPAPVAVSSTSIHQTISNINPNVHANIHPNPWL